MTAQTLKFHFLGICLLFSVGLLFAQKQYDSYNGLVMAGYQGWFNSPTDGADRGWYHYRGKNGFQPGSTNIDFWPDVSAYRKTYDSPFMTKEGKPAKLYSAHDYSSVNLHFKWMQQYGIDGVFMQRFVGEIANPSGRNHFNTVLTSAIRSANEFDRAICIMYDLSGIKDGDDKILMDDVAALEKEWNLKKRDRAKTYLFHHGKPLIAVWGIGFNDGRKYNLKTAERIVNYLNQNGYSVLLGVPTYWRELRQDTESDPFLHELIKKSAIIMPWFVGRYNQVGFDEFKSLIKDDMDWCKQYKIDYAPLCFPGFSWTNMTGSSRAFVPRDSGNFLWKQLQYNLSIGAQMLYIAMFDEVDEGTAIFKTLHQKDVPRNGTGSFVGIEDNLPNDHYLWLTGQASKYLKTKTSAPVKQPKRN
ncbi:glycoside hydrolase family 71/99-like protein [Sphingobacterium multivorum]|uniref:glycoside hydrolase family 71/99-like protein n=1 Tax=Sphingobacterium multivorum TaxID=28454 RepID=UPI00345EA16E